VAGFRSLCSPTLNAAPTKFAPVCFGEGTLVFFESSSCRIICAVALLLSVPAPSWAAGAFAVGKCGAYGQAYDYAAENRARAVALKQCKGACTALTMRRACAALAIDVTNPCGPHGYAVKPRISSSLNAAMRKCYEFGGKECVIRAWACDAKG
jgi:hypothetical protein